MVKSVYEPVSKVVIGLTIDITEASAEIVQFLQQFCLFQELDWINYKTQGDTARFLDVTTEALEEHALTQQQECIRLFQDNAEFEADQRMWNEQEKEWWSQLLASLQSLPTAGLN